MFCTERICCCLDCSRSCSDWTGFHSLRRFGSTSYGANIIDVDP
jgi:hypothetical protein